MMLKDYMTSCQQRVDNKLRQVIPASSDISTTLVEAMAYSVFNGGKRIRPVLAYAANQAVGGDHSSADAAACAVELIHAYSLVHDDLPAMDDDDLRRGKPTCHKAFDEATAILAGDALQTLAFETLCNPQLLPDGDYSAESRLKQLHCLAEASGHAGMAGGQSKDLLSVGKPLTAKELQHMHNHKTGALIRASVQMGALSHRFTPVDQLEQLDVYAKAIGLAFQVQDDILDVVSDTKTLGKQQGADLALDKPTYVSLMGLEEAKAYAQSLSDSAIEAIKAFDDRATVLRQLAAYIIHRSH
ncbi:(2E,6E)-farnesyl diphosphate synthase [Endozoicomonas montiporae]|nr:farnesyl diphosphate synthase [Endozoicomonas montiporae]AMO58304.1 farnesyl diphosphate synthase [Endozoicomonas montiporae CL-33]